MSSYHKCFTSQSIFDHCFVIQQQYPRLFRLSTYKPIEHLAKTCCSNYACSQGKVGPQTKLIPSRIYMALINGLADKLNEFNQNAPALLTMVSADSARYQFCPDAC